MMRVLPRGSQMKMKANTKKTNAKILMVEIYLKASWGGQGQFGSVHETKTKQVEELRSKMTYQH